VVKEADMEVIVEELETIVEVTDPAVLSQDPAMVRRLARAVAATLAERDATAAWEMRERDPLAGGR
jgi:hypothetical protein